MTDDELTIEQQAAAYRFLRECSPFSSAHCGITVRCPEFDEGVLIDPERVLSGTRLDEYLMQIAPWILEIGSTRND